MGSRKPSRDEMASFARECVGAGSPAPRPWFNTRGAVVASTRLMGLMAKWFTAHLTNTGAAALVRLGQGMGTVAPGHCDLRASSPCAEKDGGPLLRAFRRCFSIRACRSRLCCSFRRCCVEEGAPAEGVQRRRKRRRRREKSRTFHIL